MSDCTSEWTGGGDVQAEEDIVGLLFAGKLSGDAKWNSIIKKLTQIIIINSDLCFQNVITLWVSDDSVKDSKIHTLFMGLEFLSASFGITWELL